MVRKMERRPPAIIAGELTENSECVCEHAPTRRDPAGSCDMNHGISGVRPCPCQTRAEKTDGSQAAR
jgi:hypothetical protein